MLNADPHISPEGDTTDEISADTELKLADLILCGDPSDFSAEIAERLPDVERSELTAMVYGMVDNEIRSEGSKKLRRYSLK